MSDCVPGEALRPCRAANPTDICVPSVCAVIRLIFVQ